MKLSFKPVWFDSLGAKSSCVLVETPDVKIIIDPGVAAMQPSFPATPEEKETWKREGEEAIKKVLKEANLVVISHYHYDHFLRGDPEIYREKTLFVKNPNEYINLSQRKRALEFFREIVKCFAGKELEYFFSKNDKKNYPDPLKVLPLATSRDFGDYRERKRELLLKGKRWFDRLKRAWCEWPQIPELDLNGVEVLFPEGKEFTFGDTRVRFTEPLFHGIEFSRVGWVGLGYTSSSLSAPHNDYPGSFQSPGNHWSCVKQT